MKYNDLISKLKRKEIASVYLFSGDETYLKEEAIRKITQILITDAYREFNYDLVYADEVGAKEIINKAASLPFLSDKRLVVVKRVERLKEAEQKKLLAFLESPPDTTCLIFVATGRVNLKGGFYSSLSDVGESVIFWPLFNNQVPSWIKDKLKENGKTIAEEAIFYLQEAVGNDLMDLNNQIEQIVIYSGANSRITLDDIKQATPDIRVGDIYEMIYAIGERDKTRSLKILNKLFQKGEEPVSLLWKITFRFRKFLQARDLLEQKVSYKDITDRLGIKTFLDKNFIKQTRNFSKGELIGGFQNIFEADRDIKTGRKNSHLVMELLILRLCG